MTPKVCVGSFLPLEISVHGGCESESDGGVVRGLAHHHHPAEQKKERPTAVIVDLACVGEVI